MEEQKRIKAKIEKEQAEREKRRQMREKNYDEMIDIDSNDVDQFQEGRRGAGGMGTDSRRQGAPQINTRATGPTINKPTKQT